ncbi:hypothetical protein [Pedobacter sp. L105]|uniref:hypothetical protein n=1 Tax=Pedobacter sp. L105 TaxID=1641871 RepID=UPI00131AF39D|nr:hypothetical protein [Pedobacter sp. L105]
MKKLYVSLLVLFGVNTFSFSQTVVPYVVGGPIGNGSLLLFQSGGANTAIQENFGLNLSGESTKPVKIFNSSLLVGYASSGADFGINNVMVNGNIGIGTSTPHAVLDVGKTLNPGDLGSVLARLSEGNTIGVGTYLGVTGYSTQISSTDQSANNVKSFAIEHSFYGVTNSSINFFRGGNTLGGSIAFNTNDNTEKMRISYNGNVGIGITNPQEKLAVNGTIHSSEVIVDKLGWSDYVFKKDYQLPSLNDVKNYIDQNQHLPDMPSEKEVIANGIKIGDMNEKLLKKIEELTLYMIELKSANEALTERVKTLEQK